MIDEARILGKLQTITGALSKLEKLALMDEEAFLGDFRSIDSAKYNLQISVEAMIDVCNHIISRNRLRVPKTNAESFEIVTESGVLPKEALPVYRSMARFRNRIVHMYDQVDDGQVYTILKERLTDIQMFTEAIVRMVCSSGRDES